MDNRELMSRNKTTTLHCLAGIKRKAPDKYDFLECPPSKQMAIDNRATTLVVKDNFNSDNNEREDDRMNTEETTYYEFENNMDRDDDNNNNEEQGKNNNGTNYNNKGTEDKIRSMVLSEEVRETISTRPHERSTILPKSIMDHMCHHQDDQNITTRALILWQPPLNAKIIKTVESIPVMKTVDEEEDDSNLISESWDDKVTIHDPGDMEI